jgi:hypothetical protein
MAGDLASFVPLHPTELSLTEGAAVGGDADPAPSGMVQRIGVMEEVGG